MLQAQLVAVSSDFIPLGRLNNQTHPLRDGRRVCYNIGLETLSFVMFTSDSAR